MADTIPGVTPIQKPNALPKSMIDNITFLGENLEKVLKLSAEDKEDMAKSTKEMKDTLENLNTFYRDVKERERKGAKFNREELNKVYETQINGVKESFSKIKKSYTDTQFTSLSQFKQANKLMDSLKGIAEFSLEEATKNENTFKTLGEKLSNNLNDYYNNMETGVGKFFFTYVKGPLEAMISPLSGLFGESLMNFGIGAPKKKRNPTPDDVMKSGDLGALYLGNILLGKKGTKKEEKKGVGGIGGAIGGMVAGILGPKAFGFVKGVLPNILAALPMAAAIGAIVTGLILAVTDGFAGMKLADVWGVGKVSAFIAGFIGGTGSGIVNAFKNAGKWALIGAGAGFFVGLAAGGIGAIPGAIIGGLIGMAIGGILGYFGGEKIAKAIDPAVNWIGEKLNLIWDKIKEFFGWVWGKIMDIWNSPVVVAFKTFVSELFDSLINFFFTPFKKMYDSVMESIDSIKKIWNSDESLGKKVGKIIWEVVTFIPKTIAAWFKGGLEAITTLFSDLFIGKKSKDGKIRKSISDYFKVFMGLVIDGIGKMLKSIGNFFMNLPEMLSKVGNWVDEYIVQPVKGFFLDVWAGIKEQAGEVPAKAKLWITEYVFSPIANIFANVKAGIGKFLDNPLAFIKDAFDYLKDKIFGFFKSIGEFFGYLKDRGMTGIASDVMSGNMMNASNKNAEMDAQLAWATEKTGKDFSGLIAKNKGFFGDDYTAKGKTLEMIMKSLSDPRFLSSLPNVKRTNDAIITKTGQVIETSPQDTIFATKNEVLKKSDVNVDSTPMLEKLMSRLSGGGTQVVNNYTSRYSVGNLLINGSVEVY